MAKRKSTARDKLLSNHELRRLQRDRDPQWRKLASADLKALAADSEGMDLLAKAIQAILRQERQPSRKSTKNRSRW